VKALIFGITGQDGSLLAKFLLNKGYSVFGTTRKINNTQNLQTLNILNLITLIEIDYNNFYEIKSLIENLSPTEIYNLSGQTSVSKSNFYPIETYNSIFNTTLYILESIRNINCKIKYFNPSSSECFGNIRFKQASETSRFNPISPYASAKCNAHFLANDYKKNYNLFVCTGILSNHESEFRSNDFVTKKIILSAYKISKGQQDSLEMGNISIIRDWGWAEEYIEAIYLMMNSVIPEDYIIATGKSISLEEFIFYTFKKFNLDYKKHLKINKKFVRNNEVNRTSLNISKANQNLCWNPLLNVYDIIDRLILACYNEDYENRI